jgi:hypothetical protein
VPSIGPLELIIILVIVVVVALRFSAAPSQRRPCATNAIACGGQLLAMRAP